MLNERAPRVAVFGSKWLGAEVVGGLVDAGYSVALIAPSEKDRAYAAALVSGADAVAKADHIPLAPVDLPWRPDLCVSAGSFRIVPPWVIGFSRLGAIGYHPSLLPAFKGRHAIRDAIDAGQRVTGGSVYWLTDSIDGGPVAVVRGRKAQRAVPILPGETALELWQRALAPLGRELLLRAVGAVLKG